MSSSYSGSVNYSSASDSSSSMNSCSNRVIRKKAKDVYERIVGMNDREIANFARLSLRLVCPTLFFDTATLNTLGLYDTFVLSVGMLGLLVLRLN